MAGPKTAVECGRVMDGLEALLIQRILAGETAVFDDLLKPYFYRMLAFATRALRNRADAEDAVQEASLKAFVHLASFRQEARFSTWLFRIVLNEINQLRRRGMRWPSSPLSQIDGERRVEDLWQDPGPTPLELLEQKDSLRGLRRSVRRLPAPLRTAVVLRDIAGLDIHETARRMNLTSAAVKTRLFRGRRWLAEMVLDDRALCSRRTGVER